ncbi:MAG: DNA methyltransferase, partial [Alphaproteobacteria bacterium]
GDVRKSPPNDNDKVLHHWGQSEGGMLDIIETFTYPGQMIVDPFCGSGTTGIAAVRANRLFLGADISEDEIKSSALRLKEFVESAAA